MVHLKKEDLKRNYVIQRYIHVCTMNIVIVIGIRTMYDIRCIQVNVHYMLVYVQCMRYVYRMCVLVCMRRMYDAHCTTFINNTQMYIVQCTLYNVQCTLYIV